MTQLHWAQPGTSSTQSCTCSLFITRISDVHCSHHDCAHHSAWWNHLHPFVHSLIHLNIPSEYFYKLVLAITDRLVRGVTSSRLISRVHCLVDWHRSEWPVHYCLAATWLAVTTGTHATTVYLNNVFIKLVVRWSVGDCGVQCVCGLCSH